MRSSLLEIEIQRSYINNASLSTTLNVVFYNVFVNVYNVFVNVHTVFVNVHNVFVNVASTV